MEAIILIGFMGVGKTTLGKRLANRLAIPFLDTDQLIQARTGKKITEIFEREGEESFRKMEHELIREEGLFSGKVVSLGGGMPCYNDNMSQLNSLGITIYLHRPAKELYQRLKQNKSKRPLIAELNDDDLLHFVEHKLADRELYYRKAKIIANRDQQHVDDLISAIESYKY